MPFYAYQVLAQTFDATLCLLVAELTTIQFHGKQKRQRFQSSIFVAAPNFEISSVCRDFVCELKQIIHLPLEPPAPVGLHFVRGSVILEFFLGVIMDAFSTPDPFIATTSCRSL